jgi:hypothetical protein
MHQAVAHQPSDWEYDGWQLSPCERLDKYWVIVKRGWFEFMPVTPRIVFSKGILKLDPLCCNLVLSSWFQSVGNECKCGFLVL